MEEPTTPSTTPSEFMPDAGGGESADANVLMVAAYLVFWVLLVGFVALSWRRQQRIDDRLSQLERAVRKKSGADAS